MRHNEQTSSNVSRDRSRFVLLLCNNKHKESTYEADEAEDGRKCSVHCSSLGTLGMCTTKGIAFQSCCCMHFFFHFIVGVLYFLRL